MTVKAYIHSLEDKEHHRHVLDEAEIIKRIKGNQYLAEYHGVRCTAGFNPFAGAFFVDDVYGVPQSVFGKMKTAQKVTKS